MEKYKLCFLGTCACDFSPRLKDELRDRFDNDARRSSALMIGESLLIDCGIHTLESLSIAGKDTRKISDILITHLHGDHYNEDNIRAIASGERAPLRLWVRAGAEIGQIENVEVIEMEQFCRYEIAEGISVCGMPANHDPKAHPQHFLLNLEGKKLFYGCDGGWMLNESYNFLRGAKIDLAVLDATVGDYEGDFRAAEHNSIPMIRLLLPSLRTIGAICDESEIYLSHIAPSLHVSHAETVKIAESFGAKVAYDGLEITI
jgi:phosphoribosyl 1,2-cyclic phosphate phosphodiesterase